MYFPIAVHLAIAQIIIIGCGLCAQTSQQSDCDHRALREPQHAGVFVVAHRGAHDLAPENSIAAIQRAIDLKCDFVEVDVRTSKDGKLVIIHDARVDAYTADGSTGIVAEMTLAELQEVDIGTRIGPSWSNQRIPTLEEVVRLCKGKIGIYLDIKSADLAQVHAIVEQHGIPSDTLWYIPGDAVKELRQLSSECWPMPDPGPELKLEKLLNDTKACIIASTWRHISAVFVEKCHRAHALVIVDEGGKQSWKTLREFKVDGIQTDYPADLIAWLKDPEK